MLSGFLFFSAALCMSAELQNITLQLAVPASSRIKLDGKLTEDAWKKAPVHDKYYVYLNKMGSIALTRTSCRLIYDAEGIYIGIENFCDAPQKIRRTITTNNHVDIWRDDCAEIYFNPLADRISYIRYAVNANSATHSMSRDTTTLVNSNYMTPGSKFHCSIEEKSWNIEGFFPWEDLMLSRGAKPGDLWQFAHIRFAWPDNKFIGSSSAVHAAYAHPEDFGYLLFTDGKTPDLKRIGAILNRSLKNPWGLGLDDKLLSGDGTTCRIVPLSQEFGKVEKACNALSGELQRKKLTPSSRKIFDGIVKERKQLESLKKSNPVAWLVGTMRLMEKFRDLQWRVRLEEKYQ